MGCNADELGASPVPRDNSRCFVCGGLHILSHSDRDCIMSLSERVKELESKLGAVSQRESATREDAVGVSARGSMEELSTAAAPSVSAEEWRGWARENRIGGRKRSARACDLAAAVTKACEYELDVNWLCRIVLAFVRGEAIPGKKE